MNEGCVSGKTCPCACRPRRPEFDENPVPCDFQASEGERDVKPYMKPELSRRDNVTQVAANGNGPIVLSPGFVKPA